MENKTTENPTATKESGKTKIKADIVSCSKQESEGAPDFLNPSVLDEVLAEKKMALMRSPDVMKFLQLHQTRLANQSKENINNSDN